MSNRTGQSAIQAFAISGNRQTSAPTADPTSAPTISSLSTAGVTDPTTTLRCIHSAVPNANHYAVQTKWSQASTFTRFTAFDHTNTQIDITGNPPNQSLDVQVGACNATESVILWSPTVTASTLPVSGSQLGFPVTGVWAAQPSTNTAYNTGLARYNFVEGVYNLLQQVTIPGVTNMGSIKSIATQLGNPWCKILQYNIINEWWPSTGSSGFFNNTLLSYLNSSPSGLWWLTSTYPTLTQVTSQDNDNRKATNVSDTTAVVNIPTIGSVTGPGNVNYAQFNTWLWIQQNVLGNAHAMNASDPSIPANPNVDGIAIDNQEIGCPYVSGNWLNTTQFYTCSAGNLVPAVQGPVQHGYQQSVDMVRATYPSTPSGEFLVLGNVDGYNFGASAPYTAAVQGKYDLPMAENPFGIYENFGGSVFANLLAGLTGMEICLRPGLNHFPVGLMEGPSYQQTFPTSQSSWTSVHWQAARYQLLTFTMLRWVAMFSNPSSTTVWLFDELLGGPTQVFQYLGQPIGARILTPLSDGTYQADFAKGSIRVNPKGNGARTFNMPFSGHFLATAGFGDATYNTGAAFTTATTRQLQDRDAIVFLNS